MPKCWDCKRETADYVLEERCTGGDSYGPFPTRDYSKVQVCANRHVCHANKAEDEKFRLGMRKGLCP